MNANTKNLLDNVAKTWKIEAKQEPENLFYYVDEINQLKSGDKSYVIGRKGMGKTAISEYYSSIADPMVFSERLSFKNFPFNYLYELSNVNYTAPNQYITIWKYLIFNSVCKMMARNNAIDNALCSVLGKLYPTEPIKALDRLIPKWTANTFGAEIIGSGITIGGDIRAFEASWIQKADAFEDIIEKSAKLVSKKKDVKKKNKEFSRNNYNIELVNTDISMEELTENIKNSGKLNFSLCLYISFFNIL